VEYTFEAGSRVSKIFLPPCHLDIAAMIKSARRRFFSSKAEEAASAGMSLSNNLHRGRSKAFDNNIDTRVLREKLIIRRSPDALVAECPELISENANNVL
jgi:hypothetical protein